MRPRAARTQQIPLGVTTCPPAATRSMLASSMTAATSGRNGRGGASRRSSSVSSRFISAHIRRSLNQPLAPRSIHHVPKLRSAHATYCAARGRLSLDGPHPLVRTRRIASAEARRRIILVEPHLSSEGHAFRGSHRRGAFTQPPVGIRDRRTKHVDVRRIQHPAQGVMARGGGAIGHRSKFEQVAVEEQHQFAARDASRAAWASRQTQSAIVSCWNCAKSMSGRSRSGSRKTPAGTARRTAGEGTAAVARRTCESFHAACKAASLA